MAEAKNDRTAGAIILRDLELFNNAAVFLEKELDPEIWREIGEELTRWFEKNSWSGGCGEPTDFELKENWVAPKNWIVGEDGDAFAWFELGHRKTAEGYSYFLADLCGVGEDEIGFHFLVDHSYFGGKTAWNAYARSGINIADVQELATLGFSEEGKGVFFIRLMLSTESLATAWECDDYEGSMLPLIKTLNAINQGMPIFQRILDGAKQTFG